MIEATLLESKRDLRCRPGPTRSWAEAETTLAFALAVYLPVSTLGGTKLRADGSERQHPAVKTLSQITGRSDGGVVIKVMNLRHVLTGGERGFAHGSAMDRQVVQRYSGHLDDLAAAIEALAAGWTAVDDLVAGMEGPSSPPGLEADTCRGQSGASAASESLPETDVRTLVTARRGQGLFRARVIGSYQHRCLTCGLQARSRRHDGIFLRAGHVKPWSAASAHERLDPGNGLSLCVTHDRAFEVGLLTVDEDLRIVVVLVKHHHRVNP